MGSQVATWILTIISTIVIPRLLGAAIIGQLQLATAIWAIGLAVMNFGMDLAQTKAVARDQALIGQVFMTSAVARLTIAIPVGAALFVFAQIAGYERQLLVLLIIIGVLTVVQAVSDSAMASLVGVERMGAVSAAAIAGRLLAVGGAIGLLALGFGVFAVAIVAVGGVMLSAAIQLGALRRIWKELDDGRSTRVSRAGVKAMLGESRPYFWISFFMIAYQQVDTIVISLVVDEDKVLGWYSVYDRLAGTLMFVPTVFMAVAYPALSRLYGTTDEDDRAVHRNLTQRTFQLMLLFSVPAGFGLSVVSRPIVELLYGNDFSEAAEVVAVGGVVISLTYLTTILGIFLVSMDKERPLSVLIGLAAVLTIPLDLLFVPFFQSRIENGAVGGAVAYAITEAFILSGAIYLLPRGSLGPSPAAYTVRVVGAGLIMVAAIYPLRGFFLPVPIAVGVVIFIAAAAVLRLTTAEDRALLVSLIPDRLLLGRGR